MSFNQSMPLIAGQQFKPLFRNAKLQQIFHINKKIMARQKSIRDIINQRNRIQQELVNRIGTPLDGGNFSNRYRRTSVAATRYVANAERQAGSSLNREGRWNDRADIKVARRTYMGLSKG